jgi:hypothetical protein
MRGGIILEKVATLASGKHCSQFVLDWNEKSEGHKLISILYPQESSSMRFLQVEYINVNGLRFLKRRKLSGINAHEQFYFLDETNIISFSRLKGYSYGLM